MPPVAPPTRLTNQGCQRSGPCCQSMILLLSILIYTVTGGIMFFYVEQCAHENEYGITAQENISILCDYLLLNEHNVNKTTSNHTSQPEIDSGNRTSNFHANNGKIDRINTSFSNPANHTDADSSASNQTLTNTLNIASAHLQEICATNAIPKFTKEIRSLHTCTWELPQIQRWMFFCWVTITTIGYGDVTPSSDTGKLLIIPYSLIGIPLVYAFLAVAGFQIKTFIEYINELIELKIYRRSKVHNKELKVVLSSQFFIAITLLVGMWLAVSEVHHDISYLDGFYFAFISLSTIGYGDYYIGPEYYKTETWKKLPLRAVSFVILLTGLALLATTFYAISDFINSDHKLMQICKCCRSQTLHLNSKIKCEVNEGLSPRHIEGTSFKRHLRHDTEEVWTGV